MQVVERIIGEKSIAHQNLTKRNKKTSIGRARHSKAPKRKPYAEEHLYNLEVHDKIADDCEELFSDQLYFHTLSIDQVTKEDTQAILEIEVECDQCKKWLLCKVYTDAKGNVISLNTYK